LLRLLTLPEKVREYLDSKQISMGHARAIINSINPEELAKRNAHGVPLEKIKAMIASHTDQGLLTLKTVIDSKDMYKQSNVLYSCVLLDEQSRKELLNIVRDRIPKGWKIIAHHMTINMGELKDKTDIGKDVTLTVEALGLSDMTIAVKVIGYPSKNEIPHITIAVNPNGGKPVMSNNITNWQPIDSFELNGVVTEITK
jgi:hypothetical protein